MLLHSVTGIMSVRLRGHVRCCSSAPLIPSAHGIPSAHDFPSATLLYFRLRAVGGSSGMAVDLGTTEGVLKLSSAAAGGVAAMVLLAPDRFQDMFYDTVSRREWIQGSRMAVQGRPGPVDWMAPAAPALAAPEGAGAGACCTGAAALLPLACSATHCGTEPTGMQSAFLIGLHPLCRACPVPACP